MKLVFYFFFLFFPYVMEYRFERVQTCLIVKAVLS